MPSPGRSPAPAESRRQLKARGSRPKLATERGAQGAEDLPARLTMGDGREGTVVDLHAVRRMWTGGCRRVRPGHAPIRDSRREHPVVAGSEVRPSECELESGLELDGRALPRPEGGRGAFPAADEGLKEVIV